MAGKWNIASGFAAGALAVWLLSVLCHDLGTDWAQGYFVWAQTPGSLHVDGGSAGFVRGEALLQGAGAAVLACLAAAAAWAVRGYAPGRLAAAALPWAVWAGLSYAAWIAFIVFASELVHCVQYALIGALLAWALGGGRRPLTAFVLAVLLGLVDEVYQHYVLHRWWLEDPTHWLDWSDPILNALGACGGILPFVTRARLRQEPTLPEGGLLWQAVAALALLLLPLLLLDPVATARLLGHYPTYPMWNEFANGKPVYWPQPRQGIPFFLAAVLVLGGVVRGGRDVLTVGGLAAVAVLLALSLDPPSRQQGQPVHEAVASTRAPYVDDAAMAIDGRLDESAWATAPRLGPFVDNRTGKRHMAVTRQGRAGVRPLQATHARLLWGDRALYVAFEVEDADLWGRPLGRDEAREDLDELVAVLIDDGNDEVTFYAYGVTPGNAVSDQYLFVPEAPVDYDPWKQANALPQWDARGLQTAVRRQGSLELSRSWGWTPFADRDRGYTAELAIPWENFQLVQPFGGQSVRQTARPGVGDCWRMGLFRTDFRRMDPASFADSSLVGMGTAVDYLDLTEKEIMALARRGSLKAATADSAHFYHRDVILHEMARYPEIQAWTPTYNASFRRPPRFGVVEFVGAAPGAGPD